MHCYLKQRKENGVWYIYAYDSATGQCSRASTHTRNRGEADRKLADHILRLPQLGVMRDVTLAQILLRYWDLHGHRAFSTSPIRRVMGLIAAHEPDTRLYDWGIPAQRQFAGKCGNPGTQRRYMGQIRAAVQWWFDNGEIPVMPAIYRPQAEDGTGVAPLPVASLKALLAAAKRDHERLFLLLCIATASRPGAVLRLTWDRVKPGLADMNTPGRRRTKKRYAIVPLAPTASVYLEARRSVGPVVQWRGRPITAFSKLFARIAGRAGITGTVYGVRKAVAIWLRASGVPELDVKGMLGHSAGMSDRYAHYRPEYMRASADAVEALLREVCPPWLANYLPAQVSEEVQVLEIIGGPCRTRTYDQFLKRGDVYQVFQGLKVSNDD